MAIREELVSSTGMYATYRTVADSQHEHWKHLAERLSKRRIELVLPEIEQSLRAFIESHGGKEHWTEGNKAEWWGVPTDAPQQARDACEAARCAHVVRDNLENMKHAKTVKQAIYYGEICALEAIVLGERLHKSRVRPFETFVRAGKKQRGNLKKNGQISDVIRQRILKLYSEAKPKSGFKMTGFVAGAHEKCRVSESTVWRVLRENKTRCHSNE